MTAGERSRAADRAGSGSNSGSRNGSSFFQPGVEQTVNFRGVVVGYERLRFRVASEVAAGSSVRASASQLLQKTGSQPFQQRGFGGIDSQ